MRRAVQEGVARGLSSFWSYRRHLTQPTMEVLADLEGHLARELTDVLCEWFAFDQDETP
jgi:hypothetical protein